MAEREDFIMYFKLTEEQGKRFTFFSREVEINGIKTNGTEKCVFGTLSEGIKTGENNGAPIYENDYWKASFCGKALEKAKKLKDKDKIVVTEMNVRNIYIKNNKKSYPQITVTEFELIEKTEK